MLVKRLSFKIYLGELEAGVLRSRMVFLLVSSLKILFYCWVLSCRTNFSCELLLVLCGHKSSNLLGRRICLCSANHTAQAGDNRLLFHQRLRLHLIGLLGCHKAALLRLAYLEQVPLFPLLDHNHASTRFYLVSLSQDQIGLNET